MSPTLIVLHADASPHVAGTLAYLAQRESKVSYHYVIGRTGEVYCCVEPRYRAWHAGESAWHGLADCNDYSVGVCFGNRNDGIERYPEPQVARGALLCADLIRQYPAIRAEDITTHAAVALPRGRKTDPGPRFNLPDFIARVRALLTPEAA